MIKLMNIFVYLNYKTIFVKTQEKIDKYYKNHGFCCGFLRLEMEIVINRNSMTVIITIFHDIFYDTSIWSPQRKPYHHLVTESN